MSTWAKEVLLGSGTGHKDLPYNIGDYTSVWGSWTQWHGTSKTRKRVLINAFTVRALCDTFPPARGAGIMALCATSSYYDITEIVTRILPNIVVLTIDPDSDVRSKSFQAVDQFLKLVKEYNEKGDAGDQGVENAGGTGNLSLLGWAIRNLSLKGKAEQAPSLSEGSNAPITTISDASSVAVATSTVLTPLRSSSSVDLVDQPAPNSPTSTDGWGELENGLDEPDDDKEGWDDIKPLEEPKPSIALDIQAAQKRPVSQPETALSQPKPAASRLASKSAARKAKDEDDDLWGSIDASPSKTTSKALHFGAPKSDDDDLWGAIAAAPPMTKAKPLSAGRGRAKPA